MKCSHPLSASIIKRYSGCVSGKIDESGTALGLYDVTGFKNHEGMGLSGNVDGHLVLVGNMRLMEIFKVSLVYKSHT